MSVYKITYYILYNLAKHSNFQSQIEMLPRYLFIIIVTPTLVGKNGVYFNRYLELQNIKITTISLPTLYFPLKILTAIPNSGHFFLRTTFRQLLMPASNIQYLRRNARL